MKAFVLGAGLGTRLRPLTDHRPKPLVPLFGKPLITFGFDHLIANGITSFAVNTHHCPKAYGQLLKGNHPLPGNFPAHPRRAGRLDHSHLPGPDPGRRKNRRGHCG